MLIQVVDAVLEVVDDNRIKKDGREREIRTPGGMTLTGFQDRHIRPL